MNIIVGIVFVLSYRFKETKLEASSTCRQNWK